MVTVTGSSLVASLGSVDTSGPYSRPVRWGRHISCSGMGQNSPSESVKTTRQGRQHQGMLDLRGRTRSRRETRPVLTALTLLGKTVTQMATDTKVRDVGRTHVAR